MKRQTKKVVAMMILGAALLMGANTNTARAAKNVDLGVAKLVLYGGPQATIENGQVHVWYDYSWYIKVAGEKVAKDRGRMFSIRVGVDGHFRGEFEKHGLKFIYEGQVRGNHVEMTVECEVDKKIGGKPVKKKFTLLKANIRIG